MPLYMNMIKQALRIATKESFPVLIKETLKRFNLHGGLWLFIIYLAHRITGKTIVYKDVLGSKMKLNIAYGGVHSELFLHSIREEVATKYFMHKLNKNMTVVDIGANIGYYALLEARTCKKVYAIEPAPNNYQSLIENIKLNNYQNIETSMIAIGDKEGDIQFKLSKTPNWHKIAVNGNGDITVPITTLDKFLKGKKVDIIRMDVEGYEANILEGMGDIMKNNHLLMFIETHNDLMAGYGKSLRLFYELLARYNYYLNYSVIQGKEGVSGRIRDLINNPALYQGLGSWIFVEGGQNVT